ncbi:uncharacterized protein LOC132708264 [Cylas formicarius]|uniref:uncharacterized protein LOC132708264 n=1 Tax=Cylas formicarius TaxID=197179 RepID=UPI0029586000|nr:uncharacterized protein LOC132708264 [Cylas formicarius]
MFNNYFLFLLFLLCVFCDSNDGTSYRKHRYKNRNIRHCKLRPSTSIEPFYTKHIMERLLKGLIGLYFCRQVGEIGLDLLIDLPIPLVEYQEQHLKARTVCYDVGGWPIHPDTGERTVRVLPKKSEFCLNVVFLLAYPLTFVLQLCSMFFCIGREYKEGDETCFKEVNVIKFNGTNMTCSNGPQVDIYNDDDLREARDTKYVINMMKQSQMSLAKLNSQK